MGQPNFNLTFQMMKEPRRAVCFSPERHQAYKIMEVTKNLVKIANFIVTSSNNVCIRKKFMKMKAMDHDEFNTAYDEKCTEKKSQQYEDTRHGMFSSPAHCQGKGAYNTSI